MNNLIFELKNISFSYLGKFPALSGVNLDIQPGEKLTVIGANGSGKSTLLHMLDGLIFPDQGTIKAFGDDITENVFNNENFSKNFRMKVGLVFQNPDVQLFCPTAREDIIFGPLQFGMEKKEIENRLEELAAILNLEGLLDRPPHQLSIGEKRKVALASTLIINPDVLILDEPTAGLDPLTTRHIIELLIQANHGSGKSTLLHMLDGLIFPDQGTIKSFGNDIKESVFNDENFSKNFRRKVGLVFQNPDVQLFCPTAKEDIIFGPLQLGIKKKEIENRLEELAGILNLKGLLDRPPHRLSIGEKRKVALASTLIINPDVLILDEPTAGLDPLTTRHIIDLLIQANGSGKTIVISTHDLHVAKEISDMIYVFSPEKTIVKSGKPEEILNDGQLLHDNNLIHSHKHEDKTHIYPHLY